MAINEELNIELRRRRIKEILGKEGKVKVTELGQLFGTSEVTIRSDLSELEKEGALERVHGGAIPISRTYYNMNFYERKASNVDEKRRIAAAVASMIEDGETVMINSGTTTYFIACELKNHKNLSIVTNSVSIAMELGQLSNLHIILLGGSINVQYSFTYGNDAISQLKKYKTDKLILSVDGISADAGITTYHFQESEVNKTMMERVNNTIIVADYSKIGRESFSNIASIEMIDYLITNNSANREELDKIEEKGVEVKLV